MGQIQSKEQREAMALNKKARPILLVKYNNSCADCGATENLQVDHIVAISNGGSTDIGNLQILCKPCNQKKGGKKSPGRYGFAGKNGNRID